LNTVNQRRISMYAIIICGLFMILVYHVGFGARYSLEQYGERPRQSIGTLTGFSNEGAYWFVGGMALLFALYGLGFVMGVKTRIDSDWVCWRL
jgi:succinate dehydrogenase/fumarate reductase cytochrome b subunit